MTQHQSPAQRLGFKVGDKFEVTENDTFVKGSIVTLYRDDGSHFPLFTGEGTNFHCGPGSTPGAYASLSSVRKLEVHEIYKVGDKFTVKMEDQGFKVGTVVTLREFDKVYPGALFNGDNYLYKNGLDEHGNKIPGAWLTFGSLDVYVEPEPVIQPSGTAFVKGVSYKLVDKGYHTHWSLDVGTVYVAGSLGILSGRGGYLSSPYDTMIFEVVGEAEVDIKPALTALKELQAYCHNVSVKAGWWNDVTTGEKFDPVAKGPEKIALMHSELSEALEGLRKDLMDDKLPHRPNAEVELADAVIRILDWAGAMGYDIAGAIEDKLEYNASREDHKLENRQATGGKKF